MALFLGAEKRTFYFFALFRGRPRGRKVNSSPNRFAARLVQASLPNGEPRWLLCPTAATSASVCGSFTGSELLAELPVAAEVFHKTGIVPSISKD